MGPREAIGAAGASLAGLAGVTVQQAAYLVGDLLAGDPITYVQVFGPFAGAALLLILGRKLRARIVLELGDDDDPPAAA